MKELKAVLCQEDFEYVCELDDLMRDEVWMRRIRGFGRAVLDGLGFGGLALAAMPLPPSFWQDTSPNQTER
jgi:hypothetical protein